ncbi:MAG: cupin domain-containing protein [Betaproteobacteria bacterium]|nr:cupin domain-containing protein [Betaproteobacteria bacterium]
MSRTPPGPETDPVTLPADIRARLLEAVAPLEAAPPGGLLGRILQRARTQISGGTHTVYADSGQWQSLLPKVGIKVLREHEAGVLSYLLRLEPGAELPPHEHPQDEECMVLEGEVRIGDLVVSAGAYHVAPRGVPHGRLTTATGALLFLRSAPPTAACPA